MPRRLLNLLFLSLFAMPGFTACQPIFVDYPLEEVPVYLAPHQQAQAPLKPQKPTATIEAIPSKTAEPTEVPPLCLLAEDPEYGFSPDNPIQVGNTNLKDGPEREQLYLLTLRGPENQEIVFSRQAPQFNQSGTIVDPYQIEYDGLEVPVLLYFDLYNFASLQVPIGFTCEAAFPIPTPQE
jgi:hypothetical protein